MFITKFPVTLFLLTLFIWYSCFQTTYSNKNVNSKRLQLRMIHIDSPYSPMYQPSLTKTERIKRLIARSKSRMHFLAKNISKEHASWYHELDKQPEIGIQGAVYYVELGLGEFVNQRPSYHPIYLILDTGSNFTWSQCEGCTKCFHQIDPYFPTASSTTFRSCRPNECPQGQCSFLAMYGDATTVKGFWAKEKLTFPSIEVGDETMEGFTFLCGIEIQNFIAGIYIKLMYAILFFLCLLFKITSYL